VLKKNCPQKIFGGAERVDFETVTVFMTRKVAFFCDRISQLCISEINFAQHLMQVSFFLLEKELVKNMKFSTSVLE